MYVVIVGCGRVGARLAKLLESEGHEVAIVDRSPQSFKRLEEFKGKKILGNAIDIDVLKKAGIEKADAFAATTNGDNTNLMTAQVAQKIFSVPKVVCRVYDPRRAGMYYDLGLLTVSSTTVGARMFRNIITNPTVLRSYQLGDGTAQAVEVKVGPRAAGKPLQDLEIPGEFAISGIVRNGIPFVPRPEDPLEENDQIFGVVMSRSVEKMRELCDAKGTAINYPDELAARTAKGA